MPSTFHASAVVLVALLPGALYVCAFERQAGRYGTGLSDPGFPVHRGSALFLAVFAGPLNALHVNFTDGVLAERPMRRWVRFRAR